MSKTETDMFITFFFCRYLSRVTRKFLVDVILGQLSLRQQGISGMQCDTAERDVY